MSSALRLMFVLLVASCVSHGAGHRRQAPVELATDHIWDVVTVDAETGVPVPGAELRLSEAFDSPVSQTIRTDTSGRARIHWPTNCLNVVAKKGKLFGRNHLPSPIQGRLYRLPMVRDRSVDVMVTDTNGVALSGVRLRWFFWVRRRDDEFAYDGTYGVTGREGRASMRLSEIDGFHPALWNGEATVRAFWTARAGAEEVRARVEWQGEHGRVHIKMPPVGWIEVVVSGVPEESQGLSLALRCSSAYGLRRILARDGIRRGQDVVLRYGPLQLGERWTLEGHVAERLYEQEITGPEESGQVVAVPLELDLHRVVVSGQLDPTKHDLGLVQEYVQVRVGSVDLCAVKVGADGSFEFPLWLSTAALSGGVHGKLLFNGGDIDAELGFEIPPGVSHVDLGTWSPTVDMPQYARLRVRQDGKRAGWCVVRLWQAVGSEKRRVDRENWAIEETHEGVLSLRGNLGSPLLIKVLTGRSESELLPLHHGADLGIELDAAPLVQLEVRTDRLVECGDLRAGLGDQELELIHVESDGIGHRFVFGGVAKVRGEHELWVQSSTESLPVMSKLVSIQGDDVVLVEDKGFDLRGKFTLHDIQIVDLQDMESELSVHIVDFASHSITEVCSNPNSTFVTQRPREIALIMLGDYVPRIVHLPHPDPIQLESLTEVLVDGAGMLGTFSVRCIETGLEVDLMRALALVKDESPWLVERAVKLGSQPTLVGSYPPGAKLEICREGFSNPIVVTVGSVQRQVIQLHR